MDTKERHVVRRQTDVEGEHIASVFRAEEQAKSKITSRIMGKARLFLRNVGICPSYTVSRLRK
jgi:hypothetical protein